MRRFKQRMGVLGTLVGLVMALAACSTSPAGSGPDDTEKLYAEAREELGSGAYDKAIKLLERIEARTTGTLTGQQALLDLAYAQWKSSERAAALATVDRFMKLHPSSPAMDYALYLRGLVNFNDDLGFLGNLARQRVAERDQKASREAYQSFSQLLLRYPQSRYAQDAQQRMDFIVNALAEYEVHVARYYLRRGAWLAAANRARQAVTDYERAPAAEEALAIMAASYAQLGLSDLQTDAQRVLQKNFPSSRFLQADILTAKP